MNNNHSNTAILVFAQRAAADAQHKSIAHNEPLMQVLMDRVGQTVEKSGFDYFHFTEDEQEGTTFGSRFSNAIQRVIGKGYDHVICIGNDTPQLQVSHIQAAARSLAQGIAINGPSLDGGFYLMGIQAAHFDSKRFESLPWQTSQLAASYIKSLAEFSLPTATLEYLADLDTQTDVDVFLNGKDLRNTLIQKILGTLAYTTQEYKYTVKETATGSFEIPLNKGSPASIAA